jgi:hypothetical protein
MAVAAGMVMASGADAQAFVARQTTSGLPVHWARTTVAFEIDAELEEAVPGGTASATAALQAWSGVGGAPIMTATVGIGDAKPANDGKNIVYYARDGYAPAGGALAVTLLSFDEITGDIVDADIVIDGKYPFADLPASARHDASATPLSLEGGAAVTEAQAFDLTHVIAHEAGHALGLRDEPADTSAMMYPFTFAMDASVRAPAADDAAGLEHLYVSSSPSATSPRTAGGCGGATVAPRSPHQTDDVWACALLALSACVVRSRASSPRRGARAPEPS